MVLIAIVESFCSYYYDCSIYFSWTIIINLLLNLWDKARNAFTNFNKQWQSLNLFTKIFGIRIFIWNSVYYIERFPSFCHWWWWLNISIKQLGIWCDMKHENHLFIFYIFINFIKNCVRNPTSERKCATINFRWQAVFLYFYWKMNW